jgi:hypothetical protein
MRMMYPAAPIQEKMLPVHWLAPALYIANDEYGLHIDHPALPVAVGVEANATGDNACKNIDGHREKVSRGSSKA